MSDIVNWIPNYIERIKHLLSDSNFSKEAVLIKEEIKEVNNYIIQCEDDYYEGHAFIAEYKNTLNGWDLYEGEKLLKYYESEKEYIPQKKRVVNKKLRTLESKMKHYYWSPRRFKKIK
jgi:hypothetical protein